MNRFAALLTSSDDDDDTDSPLQRLSPQYTFQEILALFNPSKISPASFELTQYENVSSRDILQPECSTFTPPKSDINSPPIQPNQNQKRTQNPQNSPQKRGTKQSPKQKQKPIEKTSVQPILHQNLHQFTEEELLIAWYYKDPTGYILGPYLASDMKQWLEKRLLHPSFLVCQGSKTGVFQPISTIFPDLTRAFEVPLSEEKIDIQKPTHTISRKK